MSRETARIRLEAGSLTVDLVDDSELLSGPHRIYFVNVLGLDPNVDSAGYVMNRTAEPNLVIEILDYLQQQEISVDLNARAKAAIKALENASGELARAKDAGYAAKHKPLSEIAVVGL